MWKLLNSGRKLKFWAEIGKSRFANPTQKLKSYPASFWAEIGKREFAYS